MVRETQADKRQRGETLRKEIAGDCQKQPDGLKQSEKTQLETG